MSVKRKMFSRILAILIFAFLLLCFFLADTLVKYSKGGETAADPTLLLLSILVPGGGIAIIGTLMWREWKRLRQQRDYYDDK